jgi:hypothetical protein
MLIDSVARPTFVIGRDLDAPNSSPLERWNIVYLINSAEWSLTHQIEKYTIDLSPSFLAFGV